MASRIWACMASISVPCMGIGPMSIVLMSIDFISMVVIRSCMFPPAAVPAAYAAAPAPATRVALTPRATIALRMFPSSVGSPSLSSTGVEAVWRPCDGDVVSLAERCADPHGSATMAV